MNQAARLTDAAAHGGQVALEEGLALKVWQHWRNQAEGGQPHTAASAAAASDAGQRPTIIAAHPGAPVDAVDSSEQQPGVVLGRRGGVRADNSPHVPVQLVMQQLGSFLFKGCAKSMSVVSVVPERLSGRVYPAGAPKGKGVRLTHACGILQSDLVVLLPAEVAGVQLFADTVTQC